MIKKYSIKIDKKLIGYSDLEKADAPMGVVFGLIEFNGVESPFEFFKDYCLKNNIVIHTDPKFKYIDTQVIPELKVFRKDGFEIKGVAGNAITGLKGEGYEISI